MIYTGAKSALAVAKWGTSGYVKIPYSSEGLKLGINYVDSEAMIGKRGVAAYGQTSIGVDGDVSFEAFPQSLTWGLYAVLGNVTTAATASITDESLEKGTGSKTEFALDHKPVAQGSVSVTVNSTAVTNYTVDYDNGIIIFNEAPVSNATIAASYLTSAITAETLGTGDGTKTAFTFNHTPIKQGSEVVEKDGTVVASSAYTLDYETGVITFNPAPGSGTITASYSVLSQYTISPIDISQELPKYEVQVNAKGSTTYTYKYEDLKVGQLTLNLSNNAIPKVSLTLAGVDRVDGEDISPNVHSDDSKPFFVKQITVKAGNGSYVVLPDLTSLDLTINNNFDTDTVVLDGTAKRKGIIEQKLDITGTINALFTDEANGSYAKFADLYNSGATIGIEAIIDDSNGHSVTIEIPNVYIKEFTDNIGGPGKIPLNVSFTAIEGSGDMMTAICTLTKGSTLI